MPEERQLQRANHNAALLVFDMDSYLLVILLIDKATIQSLVISTDRRIIPLPYLQFIDGVTFSKAYILSSTPSPVVPKIDTT